MTTEGENDREGCAPEPNPEQKPCDPVFGAQSQDPEIGDDPEGPPTIKTITVAAAIAEALKPVTPATEEIWSDDPVKKKARDDLKQAYGVAAALKPPGILRQQYNTVTDKFLETANHLVRKTDGKSLLGEWIKKHVLPKQKFYEFLLERPRLNYRVRNRAGKREWTRDRARLETARWAGAFKQWSDPVGSIQGSLSNLADKIDAAHADISNDRNVDYAIYRLWFELAPIVFQLSPDAITDAIAPGHSELVEALKCFPDFMKALKSGPDRDDGSVYLINPDGLEGRRQNVLARWDQQARALGEAEAAFTLRPDDVAKLKERLADRIQREAELAKGVFATPPTP